MKRALIALAFLATAACGAYQFPGTTASGTGNVSGQVVVMPCGPVQPADKACPRRMFSGLELDFVNGATTVGTTTDPDGNYTIELSAGTWRVSVMKFARIISGPRTITVHAGDRIVANYIVDTGIRVPNAAA